MKLRNLEGERVIEAQEFFRDQGLADCPQIRPLRLSSEPGSGAYVLRLID